MTWRVRWHRHPIAGRRVDWFWGNHSSPNGSYGWRWFRREAGIRPAHWTANLGPIFVSVWGKRRPDYPAKDQQ